MTEFNDKKTEYEYFMGLALEEAKKSLELCEVPVGAVVVMDGEVISSAYCLLYTSPSPRD